jgi:hypothetical protein
MPESVYDIIIFVLKALFYGQFAVYFLIVCPWLFERFRWFRIVNMVQVGLVSWYITGYVALVFTPLIVPFADIKFLFPLVTFLLFGIAFLVVYFVNWKLYCFIMGILEMIKESHHLDRAEKKASKKDAKALAVPREDVKPAVFWPLLSVGLALIVFLSYEIVVAL